MAAFAVLRTAPAALGPETAVLASTAAAGQWLLDAASLDVQLAPESPWPLVVFSVLGWAALHNVAAAVLAQTSPAYRGLSPTRRAVWNNRVVSVAHAFLVAAGGSRVLWLDDELSRSFLYTYSPSGTVYLAAFCGYSVYDLGVITLRHFDPAGIPPGAPMFLHHLVSIVIASIPLQAAQFTFPSMAYLLNEWSTPLLHARHTMSELGVSKSNWLHQLNQLLFFLLFLFCRVCLNLWILAKAVHHFYLAEQDAFVLTGDQLIPAVGTALAALFAIINLYWFVLIVRKGRETAAPPATAATSPRPPKKAKDA